MKRVFCLLIVLIFAFLTSCNKNTVINNSSEVSSEVAVASMSFVLAKHTGERLHPILSISNTNKELLKLCYDGLVRLNGGFEAENVIAASFTQNGNSITFTIKPNALFWDGSAITADDIVYSFSVAQGASSSFSSRFKYITGYYGKGNSFTATLNSAAKRNINLFDIPIIKKNSDLNDKTPIGSGRYALVEDKGIFSLKANEKWVLGGNFKISTINLNDVPDMNTLFHTFNSGGVLATYADLNGTSAAYYGDIELREFTTNVIAFLGINYGRDFLADKRVRKALSVAINRPKLTSEVLLAHSEPIWHPFNPKWRVILETELPKDKYNKEEAVRLLDEVGFLTGKSGLREKNGKPITLNILVNSDNRFRSDVCTRIASELSRLQITVNVVEKSLNDYNNALNAKDFDLFLGEVKISNNMDISVLNEPNVNKGGWDSAILNKAFADFDNGVMGIDGVIAAFDEEMPFIPLYYKNAALAISRKVSGEINPIQNDLFRGIETWNVK